MRYDQLTEISNRHSQLLELVREGTHSTPYISSRLGVSEQTIYRDIEHLKKSGHTIKAVRVDRVWAYRLGKESSCTNRDEDS